MEEKSITIKCPYCGAEYKVSEIFYPYDLTGKVTEVIRDEDGITVDFDGVVICTRKTEQRRHHHHSQKNSKQFFHWYASCYSISHLTVFY